MGSTADINKETANATRAFIETVASQYDVAGVIPFGSRARRSHRADSDADVAVLLHGRTGKFVATKLAMADLAYEVLLETGIRIQPLLISAFSLHLVKVGRMSVELGKTAAIAFAFPLSM